VTTIKRSSENWGKIPALRGEGKGAHSGLRRHWHWLHAVNKYTILNNSKDLSTACQWSITFDIRPQYDEQATEYSSTLAPNSLLFNY